MVELAPTGKNLDRQFYHLNDGTRDPATQILDCLCCPLYFIARASYGPIRNPYPIFFSDPTLMAVRKDTTLETVELAQRRSFDESFRITKFTYEWPRSIEMLEASLDDGKMVLVQTYTPLISSIPSYDPAASLLPYFRTGTLHLFLMVGHDLGNYFYVDMPGAANFKPHPRNRDVGLVPKQSMKRAFVRQLAYYEIEARDDFFATYQPERECVRMLREISSASHVSKSDEPGRLYSYGPDALSCVSEVVRSITPEAFDSVGRVELDDTAYSMYFLALEVAFKLKLICCGIRSCEEPVPSSFAQTVLSTDKLAEVWLELAQYLSPFQRRPLHYGMREGLSHMLDTLAGLEHTRRVVMARECRAGC